MPPREKKRELVRVRVSVSVRVKMLTLTITLSRGHESITPTKFQPLTVWTTKYWAHNILQFKTIFLEEIVNDFI